jgi:hypothetical protein
MLVAHPQPLGMERAAFSHPRRREKLCRFGGLSPKRHHPRRPRNHPDALTSQTVKESPAAKEKQNDLFGVT